MATSDPLHLYDRLMAVKPPGLSANAWTIRASVSRQAFSDIRRRGSANYDTIEKLLDAIGVTLAEFEAGVAVADKDPPSAEVRAPRMAFQGQDRPRDVPIVGTAECADMEFEEVGDDVPVRVETMKLEFDDVVDHVRRPVSLDNRRDVYAIYFRGHSLEPRYEPGELAYVDPKRPPATRDYVVIQLRAPDGAEEERIFKVIAKRLVRQTASFFEVEQFNPPLRFKVRREQVRHIHRVIPWDELVSF